MAQARLLPLLILAACASAPRSAFPPIDRLFSETLCYVAHAGSPPEQPAANAELGKRSFACTPESVAIGRGQWETMAAQTRELNAQRAVNSDAALGLGLLLLTTPPAAPAPPVVCRTFGTTTICH